MCQGRNYVNGEADQKRPNSWVDGAKEREYDGKEPYWDYDWESSYSSLEQALGVMHPKEFLPHKVERSASKSKCYELQKEYNKSSITFI